MSEAAGPPVARQRPREGGPRTAGAWPGEPEVGEVGCRPPGSWQSVGIEDSGCKLGSLGTSAGVGEGANV